MADNLTISIGADSTKLRADLAVVQAQMRQFGGELKRAAQDSLKGGGDASALTGIAANFEKARTQAAHLTDEIRKQGAAHTALHSPLRATGDHMRELRSATGEFGHALSHSAERVFPRFKELLAIGLGAAVYEFGHKVREANSELRETANLAKALGISTGAVEAMEHVFATGGVEAGVMGKMMARLAVHVGDVKEKFIEATGQMPGGVEVLTGSMKHIGDAATYAAGGVHRVNESVFNNLQVLRGGHKPLVDFKHAMDDLILDPKYKNDNLGLYIAMIDRIDKQKDPFVKARMSQELMSRGWYQGAEALSGFKQKFEQAHHEIEAAFGKEMELAQHRATAFNASEAVFRNYMANLKKVVGAAIGQGLIPFFDGLSTMIKGNVTLIRQWAEALGKYIGDTGQDFLVLLSFGKVQDNATGLTKTLVDLGSKAAAAWRILKTVLGELHHQLEQTAATVNSLFGTNFNAETLVAIGLLVKLSGGFAVLTTGAKLYSVAMWGVVGVARAFNAVPIVALLTAIAAGAIAVYTNWDKWGPLLKATGALLSSLGAYVAGQFVDLWNAGLNAIGDAISSWYHSIIDKLNRIIDKAKDAIKGIFGAGARSGGTPAAGDAAAASKNAAGGYIRGPGSTTSDSIRAWLSDKEYVVNAAAVSRVGVGTLDRINSGQMPRFAEGGLVGGGGGGTAVHLHLGGRSFAMSAQPSVAAELTHAARTSHMLSAGRKPSWHGGG